MAIQVKFKGAILLVLTLPCSFFQGATGDDPGLSNVLKEQPWRSNYGVES